MTRTKLPRGAAALLAIVAMGASTGVATAQDAVDTPRPDACDGENPLMAVLLPNTVNPYYIAMRDSFVENGTTAGYDVQVAIAEDSSERQLSQAQTFVQQGACVAALNGVDSAPAASVVKIFNDAGIPVFTTNVIVSQPDMDAQGAFIQQYVGADQVEGGRIMATEALNDLGADAELLYGIVGDPEQIPTELRDDGWNEVMASNPNAREVAKVNSKVDPVIALQVTTDMLQGNPEINLLFADTGPGAVGALRAIEALGKQETVKLYAFCAADVEMTGPYISCAAQEPALYAQIVVEQIDGYMDGETVEPEILLPLKLYNEGGFTLPGEVG